MIKPQSKKVHNNIFLVNTTLKFYMSVNHLFMKWIDRWLIIINEEIYKKIPINKYQLIESKY